jgi:hypothetical protein
MSNENKGKSYKAVANGIKGGDEICQMLGDRHLIANLLGRHLVFEPMVCSILQKRNYNEEKTKHC